MDRCSGPCYLHSMPCLTGVVWFLPRMRHSSCDRSRSQANVRGSRADLLYVLLPIEKKAQDGAEELLDALGGRILLDILFEFYWTEVRQ